MNSKHRKRLAIACLVTFATFAAIAATPAIAESALSLSVDEAVKLAIANNESLKQSAIALETKRRVAGNSWSALMPSVTASASASQSTADALGSGNATTTVTTPVGVSLALDASIPQTMAIARLAYQGQLIAFEKAKQSLALSVRKSFYKIILDRANLELAKQNVNRQSESYAQTESKYRAGLVSELDYLKAKVSLETLKPKVQNYETTLKNDVDTFKNNLGLKADAEIELSGSLSIEAGVIEEIDAATTAQSESANLSVAAAQNALESAKASEWKSRNSAYIPSISLSGSVTPKYPTSSTGSSSTTVTTAMSATVSVALDNYMPWSAAHEKVAAAGDAVATAQSALSDAIKTTLITRASDRRNVNTYRSSLEALRLNVDLTQRTYNASKAAYDKGLETMTSLLSAAGDLESAELDALSKSYDLISALLEFQYETGLPLDSTGRF